VRKQAAGRSVPAGRFQEPDEPLHVAYCIGHSTGGSDMGWILVIIVGGILGWLASKVMRTDAQQGIILNIVVGIVGAALAGFLLSPILGIPTINSVNFSISSLLISFLGALILLAIVNLIRRGRAR